MLIFCGLMLFKQFSNPFFILEYYVCFSRLPWSVMYSTTHMEGVLVELILEAGIFLNNFEL